MIITNDASLPVTGEPGDPDYGSVRICQYHDADTGGLMYRVEKESSELPEEAELIAIHVNAAYCRRLLAYIQSQEGGELGAKGCMLLIRGATLRAQDSGHRRSIRETRESFPDPRRPTKHNPEGSADWQAEQSQEAITDAKIVGEHSAQLPQEQPTPAHESPTQQPQEEVVIPVSECEPELF